MLARRPTFRALRHRNFGLWAGADLFSTIGSWMQLVAQNWLVLQLTHSPAKLGITLTVQAAPALVFGLVGGALADRVSCRRLVIATQIAFALLAGALAVMTATGGLTIWTLWALSFASGCVATINGPAVANLCAQMVPAEDFGNAMAIGAITSSAGRIAGMAAAGALVATFGTAAAFSLNAVSFAGVLVALLAMKTDAASSRRPEASVRGFGAVAGLRYVARSPKLLALLALCFVLSTFGRNFQVTMAAMVVGPFHAGAGAYGLLSTVFAIGTLLGGLVAARCSRLDARLLVTAGALAAVLQVMSSVAPGVAIFAGTMLPIAIAAVVVDTSAAYIVQTHGDPAFRGRVVSVAALVSAASGAVGGPLLGWLTESLGARGALYIAGVIAFAACLAGAFALRRRVAGMLARPVRAALAN